MIRIAAVDDEMHVLERFERMILNRKELELCGLFETGEQLLDYIREEPLDAVFLDIEMPDANGLRLSEQIQNMNDNIEIIFVTAYNQYAVEAFELQALDYILKPISEERLDKTIGRLQRSKKIYNQASKPFVQCFGSFELILNGEVLTWKNSKAKEILAHLVHKKGVPVDWERIADVVWPEYDRERAQTNFHATTYLLRKRLSEAGLSRILECSRGNYRVITEMFDCDIYQLEELIKGNMIKSKAGLQLLGELDRSGYMEENGYEWAYPKAAELDILCKRMLENIELF